MGPAARLLALQFQYRQSERWSEEVLRARQFGQLRLLLAHAHRTVPFWRRRLDEAGIDTASPITMETWSRIPILSRAEAQDAGTALHCRSIPAAHGQRLESSTSGSSGRPLAVARTELSQFFWRSFLLREALWNRLDVRAKYAVIRTARAKTGASGRQPGWGAPFDEVFATGPAVWHEIRRPLAEQAAWLLREDPSYLLSFSGNLALLAQHFRDSPRRPRQLRALFGFAEVVTPDARALCQEVFGAPIIDSYSSEEAGYIALQCPDHPPALHVMSDGIFVEVLDAADRPCAPGQVGRIVVTPLHNFAMPLLRYELGDLVECGGPCPCGRGLPVLTRVLGRVRDSVLMPDGSARAAFFGSKQFYKIHAIRQYQVAQTARDRIELRLVARRPLTEEEAAFIVQAVRGDLDDSFTIDIVYADQIARAPSGKFQEFRCEIA